MTRILYTIPTLDRSGAEKQLTLLASALPREQFDIHVATLTRNGPYLDNLRAAGIEVTCLHKHWKLDPFTCWRLKQLIRKFQPDIIHSWMFTANFYARLAVSKKTTANRPVVVVSERCVDLWKGSDRHWIDRQLISRTDRLLANSEAVARFYREQGYQDKQVTVIPNGIEIPIDSDPSESVSDREQLLKELDYPSGTKLICYVGRLAKQKRVQDVVWAFQMLRQLNTNCGLLIIGDGAERIKLEELAAHFGCDHLIRFLGHQKDPSRYLQHADCFWLASEYEGMSNSIMEAMAAGLPVVASNIPANAELVDDGVTGYLAPLGDSPAYVQFTQEILTTPELAASMGAAGQEKMKSHFGLSPMIDRHVRLYEELTR
ncbi:glycosyltransferase [Polystyrenella longa]|uniref:glycosyltransferase n=1 Tax=Polystyrenella longa TaxID=2528007 RepID=UPI0011A15A4C|nr:glycosyltransferase [Polystyrenella longa]